MVDTAVIGVIGRQMSARDWIQVQAMVRSVDPLRRMSKQEKVGERMNALINKKGNKMQEGCSETEDTGRSRENSLINCLIK
jgi:hypothetical protein